MILETARVPPGFLDFEPWHFLSIQTKELRGIFLWDGQKKNSAPGHVLFALIKRLFIRHESKNIRNFMKDIQKLHQRVISMKSKFYQKFQESDFDLPGAGNALTDRAVKQACIPLGTMMTSTVPPGIDSCQTEDFNRKEMDSFWGARFDIGMTKWFMPLHLDIEKMNLV